MSTKKPGISLILVWVAGMLIHSSVFASTCLYVSSYHKGYEWSDGIEQGIATVLKGKCKLDKFYMDTKRNKSPEFGKKMGLKAKAYIEKTKPDIVIACDDNASRYLVKPYYKDSTLPFVFCGVNHNAKAYGYPYKNATGMIEIAPVKPSLKIASDSVPGVKKGIYLSVDVHSQHKEYALNKKIYAKSGITLDRILVSNMEDWVKGYVRSQKLGQFVIIGSNGGLKEWDKAKAKKVTQENTRVLTITNMSWMIDYSMLAITKSANEQGEWAAKVALEILSGTKPSSIPVVSNRKWNIYVNKDLINRAKISVPYSITSKAVNVAK